MTNSKNSTSSHPYSSPLPQPQLQPQLISHNPWTQTDFAAHKQINSAQIETALKKASQSFAFFRNTSSTFRSQYLMEVSDLLQSNQENLAETAVCEMGKTISAARAEVQKCSNTVKYYAENFERFIHKLQNSFFESEEVRLTPLGPILGIMPWNFPYWQVIRASVPALALGNVFLLKHASNVSLCALKLEELFQQAAQRVFSSHKIKIADDIDADQTVLLQGIFQSLLISSDNIRLVIEDPRVRGVTLTGSEAAGRSVGETAGRALKKVVLELGGNDAFIVLPSANLTQAVDTAVKARLQNNGQSCIAAKRFIIHKDIYDQFLKQLIERLQKVKCGDPLHHETELGPLVHKKAQQELLQKIEAGVSPAAGGGKRISIQNPTFTEQIKIFLLVRPSAHHSEHRHHPIWDEEFFGPVFILDQVNSLQEAIETANNSRFGLGASIWTQNIDEASQCAEKIESGMVFINSMTASEPQLPFGGIKDSGHGRELGGAWALTEFANIKVIKNRLLTL